MQVELAGQGSTAQTVSMVVRTIGGRDRQFRRALDSLAASTWRPLQVVVVYQGTSAVTLLQLQTQLRRYSGLDGIVVQNSTDIDDRATNLNVGWEAARGRYIGFLDDDDTLAPDHAVLLVSAMQRKGTAWAYGQCRLVQEDAADKLLRASYPFVRPGFSYKELLIENFIPIHSFLLDRRQLAPALLDAPFHGPLRRSEDWDFLLRLAYAHSPAVVPQCICTYFAATDGSNTNVSVASSAVAPDKARARAWADGRAMVLERVESMLQSDPKRSQYLAAFEYPRRAGLAVRALRRLSLTWFRLLYTAAQRLRGAIP